MRTESDRALTESIREAFPNITFTQVRRARGEDHVALVLDEWVIFRFPRTKTYERTLHTELALLAALRKHRLPFTVPVYRWVERRERFGGYAMIHGTKMTRTAVARLTNGQKEAVAEQLARFLSVLHSLPARGGGTDAREPHTYAKRYFETRRAVIRTGVSTALLRRIDYFFRTTYTASVTPVPHTTWTHSDLRDDHILFDGKKRRIAGVIDFGDARVGDPAFDFTFLFEYGEPFGQAVYALYRGPKDIHFLERARAHYLRWVIDELYYAVKNKKPARARRLKTVLEKALPVVP